jgi:hypothetical protein
MAATSSSVATSSPRSAPMTLRRSAQCPTRKPALTPSRPSSRSRYSPKWTSSTARRSPGGQGHPLDLGHHLADVVRVLGVDGGEGEAAVAPDDSRHAVHVGRGGQRVPEELCVVVRVRVDHAGHHGESPGVELRRPGFIDLPDGDDPAVADADVGETARVPGPVDDRAGSDDVVEHGTSGGRRAWRVPGAKSDDPSAYRRGQGARLRRTGPGRPHPHGTGG